MTQATPSLFHLCLFLWRRPAMGLALCLLVFSGPAYSADPTDRGGFDHLTTGFVLRGAHERLPCESCHVGGKFRGTPKLCRGCHERQSEIEASKKSPNHVPTVMECDTCHDVNQRSLSWQIVRMNHIGITAPCASCHNGISATGKTPNHIPTISPCENCHKSTISFAGARMDHTGIISGCATCHNGVIATGKTPNHIPTNSPCENCHRSTVSFAGARMDHTGITSGCAGCHNGVLAIGKPADHIPTTLPCENCHTSTVSFATVTMNHTGITTSCIACHNGTLAIGKSATHIPISDSVSCEICHKSFTSFAGAIMDHVGAGITGNCFSCHNGILVPGKEQAPDPSVHNGAPNTCELCHDNRFGTWAIP